MAELDDRRSVRMLLQETGVWKRVATGLAAWALVAGGAAAEPFAVIDGAGQLLLGHSHPPADAVTGVDDLDDVGVECLSGCDRLLRPGRRFGPQRWIQKGRARCGEQEEVIIGGGVVH